MVFDLQQKSYHYVGRYDLVRLISLKLKIYINSLFAKRITNHLCRETNMTVLRIEIYFLEFLHRLIVLLLIAK